jgi:hypothetical protein
MRSVPFSRSILALALLPAFLLSCPNEAPSTSRLRVLLSPSARTILPLADLAISSIVVNGTGPGGATFSVSGTEGSAVVDVIPGQWNLRAEASNASGMLLLEGEESCLVRAGIDCQAAIALESPAAPGTLEIETFLPDALPEGCSVAVDSTGPGDPWEYRIPAAEGVVTRSLAPGFHRVSVVLEYPDGAICGMAESVLIASACATRLIADFSARSAELRIGLTLPRSAPLAVSMSAGPLRVRGLPLSLEVSGAGQGAAASWFAEGRAAGSGPFLALGTAGFPSRVRLDVIADEVGRQGSASMEILLEEREDSGGYCAALFLADGDNASASAEAGASAPNGRLALSFLEGANSRIVLFVPDPAGVAPRSASSSGIRVDGSPKRATGLAMDAAGRRVYAWNKNSSWLAALGADAGSALTQIASYKATDIGMGQDATVAALAVSSDGSRIYVLDGQSRSVYAYAASNGEFSATAPLSSIQRITGPQASSPIVSGIVASGTNGLIAYSESGDALYYIREASLTLALVSTIDRASSGNIIDGPSRVVIAPARSLCYAACTSSKVIAAMPLDEAGFGAASVIADGSADPRFSGIEVISLVADGMTLLGADPAGKRLLFWDLSGAAPLFLGALTDGGSGLPASRADALPWLGGFVSCGAITSDGKAGSVLILKKGP